MDAPVIEIKNLSYSFPDGKTGINNISFSAVKGEFIILAGPNGSGKTTFLRHLNGLINPESKKIFINGVLVSKNLVYARKTVGMVFQDADSQIVGDTVFDEVAFGLENLKVPRNEIDKRVSKTLEEMDLDDLKTRNPSTLSGGEKRRLALAGVLVMNPEVLLFDEPFSNLDYPSSVKFLKTILSFQKSLHTIIMATHDIEPVVAHATRMVILENGEIKADALPCNLLKKLEFFGIKEPCFSKLGIATEQWPN